MLRSPGNRVLSGRRGTVVDLELQLDRGSAEAIYRQIAAGVRLSIRSDRLGPGTKLPSSRDLAHDLGVHRRTVVQAYEILKAEGWVTSGVGQGTFVSEQLSGSTGESASPSALPREDDKLSWEGLIVRRTELQPEPWRLWTTPGAQDERIRFTGATADPDLYPTDEIRIILEDVLSAHGSAALDYGPPEGVRSLREWVAGRLEARGVECSPEQVVIVSGSQQGLDLVSRLLLHEGDQVAVEEPGYGNGFRLFQANGARVTGIPVDDEGIRIDVLEQVLSRNTLRLLYVMPIFQNPTGLNLSPQRIEGLLQICRRHRVPVVEDQFDSDLYYHGAPPRPIKASDNHDVVVLMGSFSKILFPGLRLGWVVAPEPMVQALRELKLMADFASSSLAQHAMDLFCRRGLLDRHLERVREIYGRRLSAMLDAMEQSFPAGVRWTRPHGGLTLWVSGEDRFDSLELLQRARMAGVEFTPGMVFYPNGGGRSCFRLSYIRETEERIRRGIGVLGSLIEDSPAAADQAHHTGPFF